MRVQGPLLVLVLSTFVAVSGCGQECRPGAVKCENNSALRCESESGLIFTAPSRLEWIGESCGARTCLIAKTSKGSKTTVCAASTTKDPTCLAEGANRPDGDVFRFCASGTIISCAAGFNSGVEECGAREVCVIGTGGPRCVLEAERAAGCRDTIGEYITKQPRCDGDRRVLCTDGFVVGVSECGAGLCRSFGQRGAACLLSRERDPRCVDRTLPHFYAEDSGFNTGGCDGNQLFRCVGGFLSELKDCAPTTCGRPPTFKYPDCEPPTATPAGDSGAPT